MPLEFCQVMCFIKIVIGQVRVSTPEDSIQIATVKVWNDKWICGNPP